MPVQIDNVNAAKILARRGDPLPDNLAADPAAVKAYTAAGGTMPAPAEPSKPPAAKGKKPAATRPAAKPPARTGASQTRAGKWLNAKGSALTPYVSAPQAARPITSRLSGAGDGGGVLLAFVLYPIFLSLIRYGPAGPAAWFRAKWLNQPTTGLTATNTTTAATPTAAQTELASRTVPRQIKVQLIHQPRSAA